MRFAIVGCGLIGEKRARALQGHDLTAAADQVLPRAEAVAALQPGATATAQWREVVTRSDVDAVIVATTNNALAEVTLAAVRAGKHVLVEKPAARTVAELDPVIAAAREQGVRVMIGLNHRRHAALLKAREIVDAGALGPLMFVRGRYGHGGRRGYDREWRADANLAGGGELIDQGVHLIDLARWFLGDFQTVDGFAHTYFWDMQVDDNAFLLLRTSTGEAASLHVSCTEWKNLFSFEIYGRHGKLHIDGLGGSYGVERLSYYRMLPEMGPPETTIWEYPQPDMSWKLEMEHFTACIEKNRDPEPGLRDMRAALEVVEKIYRNSRADDHHT
jgi:predicted dehydrogenase